MNSLAYSTFTFQRHKIEFFGKMTLCQVYAMCHSLIMSSSNRFWWPLIFYSLCILGSGNLNYSSAFKVNFGINIPPVTLRLPTLGLPKLKFTAIIHRPAHHPHHMTITLPAIDLHAQSGGEDHEDGHGPGHGPGHPHRPHVSRPVRDQKSQEVEEEASGEELVESNPEIQPQEVQYQHPFNFAYDINPAHPASGHRMKSPSISSHDFGTHYMNNYGSNFASNMQQRPISVNPRPNYGTITKSRYVQQSQPQTPVHTLMLQKVPSPIQSSSALSLMSGQVQAGHSSNGQMIDSLPNFHQNEKRVPFPSNPPFPKVGQLGIPPPPDTSIPSFSKSYQPVQSETVKQLIDSHYEGSQKANSGQAAGAYQLLQSLFTGSFGQGAGQQSPSKM